MAKAALYCAQHSHPPNPERTETRSCPRRPPFHRGGSASIETMPAVSPLPFQACSFSLQGWGLTDLPLRASNEGLLRPRVARAQKINRPPSPPLLREQGISMSVIPPLSHREDGAGLPSTARVGRAHSYCARSASKEGTQPHPPNLFFSNSFTYPGFAFPPDSFITCPTRKPSTCCLPSLNCAACVGFFASTSSMILSSAPSSDT